MIGAATLIRLIARDIRKRPLVVLFALWLAPAVIIHLVDLSSNAALKPFLDKTTVHALQHVAMTVCCAVIGGGQILLGLAIIRDERQLFRKLLLGFQSTTHLLWAFTSISMVAYAAHFVRDSMPTGSGTAIKSLYQLPGLVSIYFMTRTVTWAPLIVDRGLSPVAALAEALRQTRRHQLQLIWLTFAVGAPTVLVAAIAQRWSHSWISEFVVEPVMLLAYCRIYVSLAQDGPPRSTSQATREARGNVTE